MAKARTKFMVTAVDGNPDTFRIKVWYEDGSGEHLSSTIMALTRRLGEAAS